MDRIMHTDSLSVGYNKKAIINGIEITVDRGEIVTLIGPNGAGKSTILRSISKQLTPISGAVFISGEDISSTGGQVLARRLSIMMTESPRPELMTCTDVVGSGRYPYTGQLGILSAHDRELVSQAMEQTETADLAGRYFNSLSDGQRQRVMLARAICQEPELLILDEPASFLDIRHKTELLCILKKLVTEKNIGVLMSMHELDLAQKISDRIICIGNGCIDRTGTPDEIFSGGYIPALYGIYPDSFDERSCTAELSVPSGEPRVFVICGNGSATEVFRALQRRNIPFAAGILHENDIDMTAARALASELITAEPFEPISEEKYREAIALVDKCGKVLCCINKFGSMNEKNRHIAEYAQKHGYLLKKYDEI